MPYKFEYQRSTHRKPIQAQQELITSTDQVSNILPFVSSLSNRSDNEIEGQYSCIPRTIPESTSHMSVYPSSIDKLPFEIRLLIANELSQYDTLSLMLVNRAFYQVAVIRLYTEIIVDPSYSYFNMDILSAHLSTAYRASYIKTRYSLKTFCKTVEKATSVGTPEKGIEKCTQYASYVNSLQVIELPDSFDIHTDFTVLMRSMLKLANLRSLYWGSQTELTLRMIDRIPNKAKLKSLRMRVDLKAVRSPSAFESFAQFNNLEHLSLVQLLKSRNLKYIFLNLVKDGNVQSIYKLESLQLSMHDSLHGFNKNIPSSMLVLTQFIIENEQMKMTDYDLDTIKYMYEVCSQADFILKYLKVLSLDSVLVSCKDASRLHQMCDMKQLQQLELKNVSEIQHIPGVNVPISMNDLARRLDTGFLKILDGRQLENVTRLRIDYREGLRDSVPAFIESFNRLEELDVTIRWNLTKLCSVDSWVTLCNAYITAILKHSGTLRKLSLEAKEDSVFCELDKQFDTAVLMKLSALSNLESLRVHGYSLQPYATLLLSELPKLKYVVLYGSSAGGAPHMGLQVVHNGVLDDWLRVRHVASEIASVNNNVEFIKIDKCLFQIKDSVAVPRDGLDRWFESKVRVEMNKMGNN